MQVPYIGGLESLGFSALGFCKVVSKNKSIKPVGYVNILEPEISIEARFMAMIRLLMDWVAKARACRLIDAIFRNPSGENWFLKAGRADQISGFGENVALKWLKFFSKKNSNTEYRGEYWVTK